MPTPEDAYRDAADRVREYLTARVDQDALDFVRLWQVNADELVERVRRIYEAHLADEPSIVLARATGADRAFQVAVDEQVHALADQLVAQSVEKLSKLGADQVGAAAAELGALGRDATLLAPTAEVVLDELTTTVVGGGTYIDRLLHGVTDTRDRLLSNIRQGLLNGEEFDDVRDRLIDAFGVRDLRKPSYNAYGSARTYQWEARRQWNDLMGAVAEASGAAEVWWSRLYPGPKPLTTPGCAARHGFRIEEDLDGQRPPRHLGCYCTVAVFPLDADLSPYVAEGDAWLKSQGYERPEAEREE